MSADYLNYLSLLESLGQTLERLTAVQQRKTTAVRADDLATLNECIKQEQVLSLTLRGIEPKRLNALSALGLSDVHLSALPERYPAEIQLRAKAVCEKLLRQYQLYHSASEVARSTLECNLHQVEKLLAASGIESTPTLGYDTPSPAPPNALRTNFRA